MRGVRGLLRRAAAPGTKGHLLDALQRPSGAGRARHHAARRHVLTSSSPARSSGDAGHPRVLPRPRVAGIPGGRCPGHLRRGQPRLLPARLLRRGRVRGGSATRRSFQARPTPLPRDPRRPPEPAGTTPTVSGASSSKNPVSRGRGRRLVPKAAASPTGSSGRRRGPPRPLELQAQVAAARSRSIRGFARAPVRRHGLDVDAAPRPLPHKAWADGRVAPEAASRSCRRSSISEALMEIGDDGQTRLIASRHASRGLSRSSPSPRGLARCARRRRARRIAR